MVPDLTATELIDYFLACLEGRSYYSCQEMTDVLLDVRNTVDPPAPFTPEELLVQRATKTLNEEIQSLPESE